MNRAASNRAPCQPAATRRDVEGIPAEDGALVALCRSARPANDTGSDGRLVALARDLGALAAELHREGLLNAPTDEKIDASTQKPGNNSQESSVSTVEDPTRSSR